MNYTFRIGKRFLKTKYLCTIVNTSVVAVFYFIYRHILADAFPDFVGAPLALIFLSIGLVVVKLTLWIANKYASSISYQVTEDGLIVVQGRLERLLPWTSFTAARLRPYSLWGIVPVEFQLEGKTLILNQYTDELCQLTGLILEHIRKYAEIDPAAEQRSQDLLGVY